MCLCVAAITQFQDLALCVHMSLCNPTHLSDDVRLALSVSSEPVFICVSMCVCVFNVANEMSGIVFWAVKGNVNSGR